MNVDVELKKQETQKYLQGLRKEVPPNKSPLLKILEQGSKNNEEKKDDDEDNSMECVGCTANVVYFDEKNKKIFAVNAGDSRCTMGKAGKAVEMSIDHKPES
jgi:serine/threonine protein phosphatase PrpC